MFRKTVPISNILSPISSWVWNPNDLLVQIIIIFMPYTAASTLPITVLYPFKLNEAIAIGTNLNLFCCVNIFFNATNKFILQEAHKRFESEYPAFLQLDFQH